MLARLAVLTLLALVPRAVAPAHAQNPLVVSVWGGNWKDTVDRVIGKAFTAKTGMPVEFEVGGTIDRLAKARVAKGNPLVDLNVHHQPRGAPLRLGRALRAARHGQAARTRRRPRARRQRSEFQMGGWAYVYTIVYRPDLVKEEITAWSDLWKPSLKGKIAMPDFDPSHIITIAALMEGGNESTWQKGQERLKALKPSIVALLLDRRPEPGPDEDRPGAGAGDAVGQRLPPPGAGHRRSSSCSRRTIRASSGSTRMSVMAGTKKADAAQQFINLALSKEIQTRAREGAEGGAGERAAPPCPPAFRGQPGIFLTPAEWKEQGYILNDDVRAKNLPGWREWFTANIVKK